MFRGIEYEGIHFSQYIQVKCVCGYLLKGSVNFDSRILFEQRRLMIFSISETKLLLEVSEHKLINSL